MLKKLRILLWVLLFLLLVAGLTWFIMLNDTPVALQLFTWKTVEVNMGIWVISFFTLGILLGWLLAYPTLLLSRPKSRETSKQLTEVG